MKKLSKVLALFLAVAMLASFMVACGGKKDEGKSDSASQAEDTNKVAGSEQTWGDITVFVPDTMDFKGGDGTFNPEDPKTVWLTAKDKPTDYIKVTIVKSEDDAKNNINTTKEINKDYNPVDSSVKINDAIEWKGITYNAGGTDCCMLYTVAGDKVYFVMDGGYKDNDDTLLEVLKSLK